MPSSSDDGVAPVAALSSASHPLPPQHPTDDVHEDDDGKEGGSGSHDSPSSSPSSPSPSSSPPSLTTRLLTHLQQPLTHTTCTLPLSLHALLTGLIDGLLYTRTTVWIGFQTGNMVQTAQGIASFIYEAHLPERDRPPPRLLTGLRALSFLSFFVASWAGSWVATWWSSRHKPSIPANTRLFLMLSSLLQSLLLFSASAILWVRDSSNPTAPAPLTARTFAPVILLTALSMGLQSIQSQKLSSPVFSTSVAYTATLTQLAADPNLFTPRISWLGKRGEMVRGRDLRVLALVCLAVGGGVSQSFLICEQLGLRGGLMVAAGLKVVVVGAWLVPRGG